MLDPRRARGTGSICKTKSLRLWWGKTTIHSHAANKKWELESEPKDEARSTLQVPPDLECCQLIPGSHPWNEEVCGNAGGKPSQGSEHSCSIDCLSEATMSCLVPSLLLARTNTSATNCIKWFNHHNNLKKPCLYFLHLCTRTPRGESWSNLQEVARLLSSWLGFKLRLPNSELSFNLCVTWLFSPAALNSTQRLGLQGTHH